MFDLILLCVWWLPCAVLSLAMTLLMVLLSPLLALFVFRKSRDLPWFLSWFGQWDDNLRASREGTSWTDKTVVKWIRLYLPVKTGMWLEAMLWIIRNPSQYFDYWFNGQTIKPGWGDDGQMLPFEFIVKGNPAVNDCPLAAGWCLRLLKTGDRLIPNFRLVWKWPFIDKCVQIWLGWQYPDKVEEIRPHSKAQLKFTINPLSKTK